MGTLGRLMPCAGELSDVAREKLAFLFPLQQIFILNQKAHYSPCRLSFICCRNAIRPPQVNAIIDEQDRNRFRFLQLRNRKHSLLLALVFPLQFHLISHYSRSNTIRAADDNEALFVLARSSDGHFLQLLKKSNSISAPIRQNGPPS